MEAVSLSARDEYELFLDCIQTLHTFRDLPSLRAWLLDTALPKLVPSDWFSYNEVNLLQPENTVAILKPEPDHTLLQRLVLRFREVAHQHPLIHGQMQARDFPVHKISDFLTREAYHQLELYQDVYRHMRVEYQMAATIKLEPDRITAFALSRQHDDYTERDRTVLEMLRPHLVVAFNNLALTENLRSIVETSTLALSELASATLIVDLPSRMILYHTGPALSWIGAASPGILPDRISAWLNPATPSIRPALTLTAETRRIRIQAVPTSHPARLLLVLTEEKDWPSARMVPDKFGLSQREIEVADWICQGKTNTEIAMILGISPRTVHKHVEHIFEKLGVESRVAMVAHLSRIL